MTRGLGTGVLGDSPLGGELDPLVSDAAAVARLEEVADELLRIGYNVQTGGSYINWRGDWYPTGTNADQNQNTDFNTDGSTDGGRTPVNLHVVAGSSGVTRYYRVSQVVGFQESIPTPGVGPVLVGGAALTWGAGVGSVGTYKVARSSDGVTWWTLCEQQYTSDGAGATQPTGNTLTVTGAGWHRNQWAGHWVTILGNTRFATLCVQILSNTGTLDGDSHDTLTLVTTWQPSSGTTTVPPPSTIFCINPPITTASFTDSGTYSQVTTTDFPSAYRHDTTTDITVLRALLEAKYTLTTGKYDSLIESIIAETYTEWSASSSYKCWMYFDMLALDRLDPHRGWAQAAAYTVASVLSLNFRSAVGCIADTSTYPSGMTLPNEGWAWQGAYDSSQSYQYPQAVTYLGINYWAKTAISSGGGNDPVSNSSWAPMPTYRFDYAWETAAMFADAATRFDGVKVSSGLHGGYSSVLLRASDLNIACDKATNYLLKQLHPVTGFPCQQMQWLYPGIPGSGFIDQPSAGLDIIKTGEFGQIVDAMSRIYQKRGGATLLAAIEKMLNVAFSVVGAPASSVWWDATNGGLWGEIDWDGTAVANGPVGSYKEAGRQIHILRGLTRLADIIPDAYDASGTMKWSDWRDQYLGYTTNDNSIGWTVSGHADGAIFRVDGSFRPYIDTNLPKVGIPPTGTFKGTYQTTSAYVATDWVAYLGKFYQANGTVAAGANDPISQPSLWTQLVWKGRFNPATTYNLGDYVSDGVQMYQSLAGSNTGNTPPNATWWTPISGYTEEYWTTSEAIGIVGGALADYLHR